MAINLISNLLTNLIFNMSTNLLLRHLSLDSTVSSCLKVDENLSAPFLRQSVKVISVLPIEVVNCSNPITLLSWFLCEYIVYFPFDQILYHANEHSGIQNILHFVYFLGINRNRRRLRFFTGQYQRILW